MPTYKYVDGQVVELTEAELTERAAEQAAYEAQLPTKLAAQHRATRDQLLADSDWTQMNDSPLTNEVKTAWATYRQELRAITDLDEWPNLSDEDWPVAP
jgi:hypothetical protein